MGSSTSNPENTELVETKDGITIYNGSYYTGYSSEKMMIEDFPFGMWEADS